MIICCFYCNPEINFKFLWGFLEPQETPLNTHKVNSCPFTDRICHRYSTFHYKDLFTTVIQCSCISNTMLLCSFKHFIVSNATIQFLLQSLWFLKYCTPTRKAIYTLKYTYTQQQTWIKLQEDQANITEENYPVSRQDITTCNTLSLILLYKKIHN